MGVDGTSLQIYFFMNLTIVFTLPTEERTKPYQDVSFSPLSILAGFKDFILRGNVVDLAVAVVIGGAFTTLVNSFVTAFVTPLIGIIGDPSAADNLSFTINGSKFPYGLFITASISFIIIILVVYFAVVMPLYKFMNKLQPVRTCPKCLSFDVPCAATVCKVCGSDIPVLIRKRSSLFRKSDKSESQVITNTNKAGFRSDSDEEIFHDLEEGSVEGSVRSVRTDRLTAMES